MIPNIMARKLKGWQANSLRQIDWLYIRIYNIVASALMSHLYVLTKCFNVIITIPVMHNMIIISYAVVTL